MANILSMNQNALEISAISNAFWIVGGNILSDCLRIYLVSMPSTLNQSNFFRSSSECVE